MTRAVLWFLLAALYAAPLRAGAGEYMFETVAEGLEHPWGMAFLPDGSALVTERPGRVRLVTPDGAVSEPVKNMRPVFAEGQGGALDIAVHPRFAENNLVFVSYAEEDDGKAGTAVMRAVFDREKLSFEERATVFRQFPKTRGNLHFGSRLVFDEQEMLFITLGERYHKAAAAQEPRNHLGAVVRIDPLTGDPAGPFAEGCGLKSFAPEVWSYGHRNSQGAALHPDTGELWIHEHGPRGGDEINIVRSGNNYGWPEVSYGTDYDGTPIPDTLPGKDFVYPVHHWTPSIAPSGMAFYTGDTYPVPKNTLFIGALAGASLRIVYTEGDTVTGEKVIPAPGNARIRDVEQGGDGYVYLLTDAPAGELLRLTREQSGR